MNIAFVIDHFRLVQTDQYTALSRKIGPARKVIGMEIYSSSDPDYPFGSFTGDGFVHEQVYKTDVRGSHGMVSAAWRIVQRCRQHKASVVFLCHYERPYIFLSALILRILGRRVIVMGDSKFDDYPRHFWRELGKRFLYAPYQGALAASKRCADYQRFLGVPANSIALNYYAFDIDRIRNAVDVRPSPNSAVNYEDRSFVCVARLVPKKNISSLIKAFHLFSQKSNQSRKLVLCGSGPLETDLRAEATKLGISDEIIFRGNLNPTEIACELARGLCLILPSLEEQYGIAVVEGQAMGLPVIVSTSCGARDDQVRSGLNGFIVEPNNPEGMAFFMDQLANDEKLWRGMAEAATRFAKVANVDRFVESALQLARFDGPVRAENYDDAS
jgi:L-malate glycosyltransferase